MKVKIFTVSDLTFHKCKECRETHLPFMPHDKDSLYYRLEFYKKNGRYPTWEDAIAHCPADVQKVWTRELKRCGVWTETHSVKILNTEEKDEIANYLHDYAGADTVERREQIRMFLFCYIERLLYKGVSK